jgi:hypothetical protein
VVAATRGSVADRVMTPGTDRIKWIGREPSFRVGHLQTFSRLRRPPKSIADVVVPLRNSIMPKKASQQNKRVLVESKKRNGVKSQLRMLSRAGYLRFRRSVGQTEVFMKLRGVEVSDTVGSLSGDSSVNLFVRDSLRQSGGRFCHLHSQRPPIRA